MIRTAILTVSSSRTRENDLSGKIVMETLPSETFAVMDYDVVKDDLEAIKNQLIAYADSDRCDLVLTSGGTGLGPEDVTPEATGQIIDRPVPGIPEFIRSEGMKKTNRAILSRNTAGIRGNTLIINLPGSPKGARESLIAVIDIIPHAMAMMRGEKH